MIRPGLEKLVRMVDWNVRTRKELPLFVRISIHDIIQEIGSNTAVVQQRIAFARRTIPGDLFPVSFCLDHKLKEFPLGLLYSFRKRRIALQMTQAENSFLSA